ncbi:ribosome biogenesis GTPase Der [Clostridia bacterium]|nr:ribosome biogenesis GTPase Der [Clostridia bacterium]
MKPIVAIVGRPNVGKSMLFNKLAGKRISIVEDTPGVTRDRVTSDCEWRARVFTLVDTGGIEPRSDEEITKYVREQAQVAIDTADVVVLVCDLRTGATAADADVASLLQRSGKPVVVAVNKNDSVGAVSPDNYGFYNLGLGDPFPVSALHGHGCGDLLDECFKFFPKDAGEEIDPGLISVALVGKPNVGKSSLVNRILGQERVIVTDIPGTTRDATDSLFENEYGRFNFIDTAGMRKKARVNERIEHFSVLRSVMAVDRADVCLIMLDARDGVTEQDTKIAGIAHDAGRACVIVVNKWDLIEKETNTMKQAEEHIRVGLPYMAYAPIVFISALTGQRVDKLFEVIAVAANNHATRIPTGQLNNILADATARVQPPSDKGRRLKIYYMTQTGVKPPTFVTFVNDKELFHFSYQRYIENQIRQTFGLEGTPINIVGRSKGEQGDK